MIENQAETMTGKIERRLRAANKKIESYQALLRARFEGLSSMMIFSIDMNCDYLYFNESYWIFMRQNYGTDISIGMNILECITSDTERADTAKDCRCVLNGNSCAKVASYGDLETRYYETHYSPLRNKNSETIGATAFVQDITLRRLTEEELEESQKRYRSLFQMASDPIFVLDKATGEILDANNAASRTYGYSIEELVQLKNTDMSAEPQKTKQETDNAKADNNLVPLRYHKDRGGKIFPVELTASVINITNREVLLVSVRDITERQKTEQILKESEEKFRLLYSSMDQGLALCEIILDPQGGPTDYRFIEINGSYTDMFGISRDKIIDRTIREIMPDTAQRWIENFDKVAATGKPQHAEYFESKAGKYYSSYFYSPQKNQFAVLVSDISDRKKIESEIQHHCFHDRLTGIYNLRFYEEELMRIDIARNYPLTIVVGDVNGLKLINDSFGHSQGDELLKKAAKIIRKGCRADDIVARIGGDEFVALLPKTSSNDAELLVQRIREMLLIEKFGEFDLSISFGFSTKTGEDMPTQDVFKRAEDSMYYNKLFESPIIKEKTLDTIIKSLYSKSKAEEAHSERVSALCENMGKVLGLPESKVQELRTVARLYDIGKIAIDEKLFNKPGTLTEDEWSKIRRHPEIGYRILSTVKEMSKIAEIVLDHHERWDGRGYPRVLKGEEIPYESRIMAIADAYDAMTHARSFRNALSEAEAIAELRRTAGSQFDPDLVKIFIEKVLGKDQIEETIQ